MMPKGFPFKCTFIHIFNLLYIPTLNNKPLVRLSDSNAIKKCYLVHLYYFVFHCYVVEIDSVCIMVNR